MTDQPDARRLVAATLERLIRETEERFAMKEIDQQRMLWRIEAFRDLADALGIKTSEIGR